MPTYRPNVSDKEQVDLERALDDSAIRVQSFDQADQTSGKTKMVKAYDGANQAPNATGATSVVRQFGDTLAMGQGHIVGQHNDKPSVFETPGKA